MIDSTAMRDVHLLEYEKLKDEQGRRIHFRDNMRYVTLAAIGVVAAQAGGSSPELWLVIPWICAVLGWNYLANAYAVTEIGKYLEGTLRKSISATCSDGSRPFMWETERQSPQSHLARRARQLVIDELTFFAPGVVAVIAFGLSENTLGPLWALASAELLLVLWIGSQIYEAAGEPAKAHMKGCVKSGICGVIRALATPRFGGAGWTSGAARRASEPAVPH